MDDGQGRFDTLDADECLALLRQSGLGRMAFHGPSGLTVLPLSFAVADGPLLVVRTAPGTELGGLAEGTELALEADEFDTAFSDGWSVLARGPLERVAVETLGAGFRAPAPFVPGRRELLLALRVRELSGRAVSAS